MPKKKAKSSKTKRTTPKKSVQYFGIDSDTLIIVGGGFLVIVLVIMALHH